MKDIFQGGKYFVQELNCSLVIFVHGFCKQCDLGVEGLTLPRDGRELSLLIW